MQIRKGFCKHTIHEVNVILNSYKFVDEIAIYIISILIFAALCFVHSFYTVFIKYIIIYFIYKYADYYTLTKVAHFSCEGTCLIN